MIAWQFWLIIAGVCLVLEILTVGFLIFWFALAALIVSFLSIFIHSVIAQTAIFIVLSAILIFFTRPLAKKVNKSDNTATNANRLIGKTAIVKKKIQNHNNGQVKVDGELWTATLSEDCKDSIEEGSTVEIISIDGVKLVVKPSKSTSKV